MSSSFVLLFTAAGALVAFSASALGAGALAAARRPFESLTAAAQARVLLGVTLLPLIAVVAVMTAASAPTLGWIADHCGDAGDPHLHPHICGHHVGELPGLSLTALAALLAGRLLLGGARLAWATWTAQRTRRRLVEFAGRRRTEGLYVLPLPGPQAFVVGALAPEIFVTEGLFAAPHREHLDAVLGHERAHLTRRDALARWLARGVLALHLPWVAGWLERRLARAQEMAADADAARQLGGERVAAALVSLTRARRRALSAAVAFGDSDVEVRVRRLLDSRPRHDQPGSGALIALALSLCVAVGVSADAVHHGLEIVLGLLSG